MTERKGSPPTHELTLWDPQFRRTAQIGVAWVGSRGQLNIQLSPGAALNYFDLKLGKLKLTLWPARRDSETTAGDSSERRDAAKDSANVRPLCSGCQKRFFGDPGSDLCFDCARLQDDEAPPPGDEDATGRPIKFAGVREPGKF